MMITDNGQLIILNRLGHIIWMSGVGFGGKTSGNPITACIINGPL